VYHVIKKKKKKKNPNKQNKIYPKINIDKGYLSSSIYVGRGGNIGILKCVLGVVLLL
jgi:hypothetical protein